MIVTLVTRTLDLIDRIIDALSATALILVTGIVFLNAVGRYLLSFTILGAEEASRLLMVYLCYFGAYTLLRRDGHVSVDVVMLLAAEPVRRVLRGLIGLLVLVLMTYLAWASWNLVAFSAGTGQRSTTLPVPRYLFFLPLAIASSLMAVAGFETVIRALTNTLRPLPTVLSAGDAAGGKPAAGG